MHFKLLMHHVHCSVRQATFGNDALHSEHGRLQRADDPEDVSCHRHRLDGLARPRHKPGRDDLSWNFSYVGAVRRG